MPPPLYTDFIYGGNVVLDNVFCTKDFDLTKTMESGQCFRYEEMSSDRYTKYKVLSADSCCIVSQSRDYTQREFISIDPLGGSMSLLEWRDYFGIGFLDAEELVRAQTIVQEGPQWLRDVFEVSSGVRLLRQDPWETLVTFIISQRNNIPRIRQCVTTLTEICGMSAYQSWCAFPTPLEVSRIALDRCNLGYRDKYVKAAAHAVLNEFVDLHQLDSRGGCSSDRAVTELMRIHGVGVKVAKCVSLFSLGHHNLFPIDVWISRAMSDFGISQEHIEHWGEAAGLIQQRLYFYMLHSKK